MPFNYNASTAKNTVFSRQLKTLNSPKRLLREHPFTDCIIQQATPGFWTTVFGDGDFRVEEIARKISEKDRFRLIGRLLSEHNVIDSIIKEIFPHRDINLRLMSETTDTVSTKVARVLTSMGEDDAVAVYVISLIMSLYLAQMGVLQAGKGYVEIDYRFQLFPNYETLLNEVLVAEIEERLNAANIKFDLKGESRISHAVLAADLTPKIQSLGASMKFIGQSLDYFASTMITLRKYVTNMELPEDDRLDNSLMANPVLQEMAANITLVAAAFETGERFAISVPDYKLETVIGTTYKMIKQSKRYQSTSLAAATMHIGHTPLTGIHQKVWGVVVHKELTTSYRSQVGSFAPMLGSSVDAFRFITQPTYEQQMDNLIATAMPKDHMARLASSVTSLLQSKGHEEGDAMTCFAVGMTELDLFHYAMARAGTVMLAVDDDNNYEMYFRVDVSNTNLKLEDPEFLNVHWVSDPMAYLMSIEQNIPSGPMMLDHAAINASHLEKGLFTSPTESFEGMGEWTRGFAKSLKFAFTVGKETISLNANAIQLLGLYEYKDEEIRAIVQPAAAEIYRNTFEAFRQVRTLLTVNSKDSTLSPAEKRSLKQQLAHSVAAVIERVALSDSGKRLSRNVIDLIRANNPSDEVNAAIRQYRREETFQAQVRFYSAFLILTTAGILSFDDYRDALALLNQGDYFTTRTNDSRYS